MKLNLGCGNKILEGWTNVDLNPKADVVHDIRSLPMFEDNSADVILASHVIEHFFYWEVPAILAEWFRILKPGGLMYIECPDIKKCAAMMLHGDFKDRMHIWGFYGDPRYEDPLMTHKWGYCEESLREELTKTGLTEITKAPVSHYEIRDVRLVGTKPGAVA